MLAVLCIAVVMCVCLITAILVKPNINVGRISLGTYWMVALIGATILVLCRGISLPEIGSGLIASSAINPLKILILFLSMTVQSIFLDEIGMFRYCANVALKKAKGSQKSLFFALFAVVSVLTVFTSNDIIILTFTPFICYFSKNAKINPIPYLFTEFVAANTWSMSLIIGNPTNVYLASANGIDFISYVKVMWFPTLCGGAVALLVLYLLFHKSFKKPLEVEEDEFTIKDTGLLTIGLIHLITCTILLVISSYIGLEMWLITMCFAISLFVCVSIYQFIHKKDLKVLAVSIERMPWELIPFVISMFVFVLAFDKVGISSRIGVLEGNRHVILQYGISSFFAANLVNNIPMSVLFSSVVKSLTDVNLLKGVFAAIVGSNVGAFFTPIGALAGIMWSGILKKHDVKFSFLTYIHYGIILSVPTLLATLLGLSVVL